MRFLLPVVVVAQMAAGPGRPFISEEGAFSVILPWRPTYDTVTEATPEGPSLRRVFRYADDEVAYFIVHACLPPPTLPADDQAALDLGRDSGLRLSGATLVSEQRVSVSGHAGTRLTEKDATGQLIYGLIVLGEHGAYYSLGAGPRSSTATKKALAFLDSFKVLPTTAKAWCKAK
jgi:hypothetical protein